MTSYTSRIIFLLLLSLLTACSSAVSLRNVSTNEVIEKIQRNVITTEGEFSEISVQTLRIQNLTEQAKENPEEAFRQLSADSTGPRNFARWFTAIELAQLEAQKAEKRDPTRALGWYLASAEKAYELLTAPEALRLLPFDFRYDHLRLFYLNSVMRSLAILQNIKDINWADGYKVTLGTKVFHLRFEQGADRFQLSDFDQIFPAATVEVEGLKNRHRRPGFGLPFAALRKNHDESPEARYYPKRGLTFPVSAALHFNATQPASTDGSQQVTLALYDTNKVESVSVRGRELTVAADFTAPFALLVSKSKLSATLGLSRMLKTEDFEKSAGFSMVQPFDPNKIPIITVHGLLSSPLTWIDLHNDLMGDPEIRKHYQIWHFSYSTGVPILYSAALFRERLNELYNSLDAKHQSSTLNNTLIIAHSMGGLLTHTVVSNSGDTLWQALFGKSEDQLKLNSEDKKEFQKVLNFEKQPFIKRVVFVAVPHRGSTMSESPIGWIGRKLISLPKRIVAVVDGLMARTSSLLKPEVRELIAADALTGIRGLSPRNPVIQTLATIPVDEHIPFHSIIGDQGSGLGVNGSDGVVAYQSSHLDGAQSELIVPADHTAHSNPLAVLEIERILLLHLQATGNSIDTTPTTDIETTDAQLKQPTSQMK